MEQESVTKNSDRNLEWRGYSIEEMEQRLVVNKVKSEFIVGQMKFVYGSMQSSDLMQSGDVPFGNKISKFITYVTYGFQAYKYVKQVLEIFKGR